MRHVDEMERLPFRMQVEPPEASPGAAGGPALGPGQVRGVVASGSVRAGDRVRIQPLGKESRVASIHGDVGELAQATPGQRVTLTLDHALALPEGAVISTTEAPASVADQFEARIVWSSAEPLYSGRRYPARIGLQRADLTVTDIKYRVHPGTEEHIAASQLKAGDVAVCNISLDRAVAFDPYDENPATGSFAVLDQHTHEPLGEGRLHFALRRAQNIHVQHVDINKAARARQKTQNPCVVWFTGLSGSGKSTIANRVEQRLYDMGHHTYLLDGDNVRHGLNRDLGFTEADRVENIRRVGEVAKLMVDSGLIVLTAFISPFQAERRMARDLLTDGEFLEVFVEVPLDIAEQRDPKGLYKKARRGELKHFTGIDSPYEPPESPELVINTATLTPEQAAEEVIQALHARGRLNTPA